MYLQRYPSCTTVSDNFHVLLSHIEELYEKHEFHGSADKLFAIVEKCTMNRPVRVASVRTHADRLEGRVKLGLYQSGPPREFAGPGAKLYLGPL